MILIIKKHDLKYFQRFLILLSLKLSRQILDDCNLTWKCLESSLFCIHAIVSLSELTVRLFILNAHNSDSSTMGTCYDPSCCFLSRKSVCMIFFIEMNWLKLKYIPLHVCSILLTFSDFGLSSWPLFDLVFKGEGPMSVNSKCNNNRIWKKYHV